MKAFSIPESWGKLDSQATHTFRAGKDAVLALMHEILNRLAWAKADQYNLIYCAGWLDGMMNATRELERAQKYPDSLRDLENMLEDVGDQYRSDLKSEGRKMGIKVDFHHHETTTTTIPDLGLSDKLSALLDKDIYPRSVPTAMFILFSESINPNVIYSKYIDGFSSGYTGGISENVKITNSVSSFSRSNLPRFDESFVFINNYIFESQNSDLIINAKLFMNPLWERSVLRLLNESDGSVITQVDVNNRSYNDLSDMKGREEDFLQAGRLMLDSLASNNNKKLIRQISKQASKQIVRLVADNFSRLIQDVYDKPFAEHVQRLEQFIPVSSQYNNFIAPDGYTELIHNIKEYISPISELSDVFFTELDRLLNELKKTVET